MQQHPFASSTTTPTPVPVRTSMNTNDVVSAPPGTALDLNDFPALGGQPMASRLSSLAAQPTSFSRDDFPALGSTTSSSVGASAFRKPLGVGGVGSPSLTLAGRFEATSHLSGSLNNNNNTIHNNSSRTSPAPASSQIPSDELLKEAASAGAADVQRSSTPLPPSTTTTTTTTNITATAATATTPLVSDRFGLLGLLGVIRMTDPDLNTLALGCDLTTLGLNLNASEPLHTTFISPWADQPTDQSPNTLPGCYTVSPITPAQNKLPFFADETLFFIFYAMPRDELQERAAGELYARNWRYHKDLKVWLTRDPVYWEREGSYVKTESYEKGVYVFFDVPSWSRMTKEFVLYYAHLESRPTSSSSSAAAAGVQNTGSTADGEQRNLSGGSNGNNKGGSGMGSSLLMAPTAATAR